MKYLSLCSLLFVVLAFGCKKEPAEKPTDEAPYYVGTAKWEMDGKIWNGVTSAILKVHRDDSVYSLKIYRNSASLNLVFHDFKLKTGNQLFTNCDFSIPDNCMYPDLTFSNGDVIYDYYEMWDLDNVATYFEITDFDLEKETAKGKFQVVLQHLSPEHYPGPDTLVLLNGKFDTLIKTKW